MIALRPSVASDAPELLRIWRDAVHSTHNFLPAEARKEIEPLVAEYVRTAPLLVAMLEGKAVGFMGVTGAKIDALFVDPRAQGRGVGRFLTDQVAPPCSVDVNEQNEAAVAFYRHLGFEVIGRSPLDDQGRPFPLLHMRRDL